MENVSNQNSIVLYTIECPKCKVLKLKLDKKNIKYSMITDIEVMKEKGILSAPILEVNGKLLNFTEANKWINEQQGE